MQSNNAPAISNMQGNVKDKEQHYEDANIKNATIEIINKMIKEHATDERLELKKVNRLSASICTKLNAQCVNSLEKSNSRIS